MIKNFLNPEAHQNPISGSNDTAILLKWQILPIGGASAVEGLRSTGLPRLVLIPHKEILLYFSIQVNFWEETCCVSLPTPGNTTSIEPDCKGKKCSAVHFSVKLFIVASEEMQLYT